MADIDPRVAANRIVDDICRRIERISRYAPLDDEEIDKNSMKDREIVANLYMFFIGNGNTKEESEKAARVNAIKLVLNEIFA